MVKEEPGPPSSNLLMSSYDTFPEGVSTDTIRAFGQTLSAAMTEAVVAVVVIVGLSTSCSVNYLPAIRTVGVCVLFRTWKSGDSRSVAQGK